MAPVEETTTTPPEPFDTSGVEVGDRPELGGAAALAARNFNAGEQVFCEQTLVVALAPTNLSRVRAYCGLPAESRTSLRKEFFRDAPAVRCAATAALRSDAAGSGDSAVDVLEALRGEGHSELTLREVEEVISVWNLNAYDCVLAPVACKVNHSCAPNVFVNVDAAAGVIRATACRPISIGEPLGSWYFQDTGLWWMGADVRRALFETDRGFLCACTRCQEPDVCRALPCDACGSGLVIPRRAVGAMTQQDWHCNNCGRHAAGDTARLSAEAEFVPRALMELRPPKGAQRLALEELLALDAGIRARLGPRHWAAAATALVLHYRARPAGGKLDTFATACGYRFLGWLIDCGLPLPPAGIIRTPIAVALDCASLLAPLASNETTTSLPDRRCLVGRLLTQFLLPVFDASGQPLAQVANTGKRVEALRNWLHELQVTCGHCSCQLAATGATSAAGPAPLACSKCKQVRYCSRDCQRADWRNRHSAGCLAAGESLAGEAAWRLLMANAGSGALGDDS